MSNVSGPLIHTHAQTHTYTKNVCGDKKNAQKCYLSSWQAKKLHLMCLKSMANNYEEVISEINN